MTITAQMQQNIPILTAKTAFPRKKSVESGDDLML